MAQTKNKAKTKRATPRIREGQILLRFVLSGDLQSFHYQLHPILGPSRRAEYGCSAGVREGLGKWFELPVTWPRCLWLRLYTRPGPARQRVVLSRHYVPDIMYRDADGELRRINYEHLCWGLARFLYRHYRRRVWYLGLQYQA